MAPPSPGVYSLLRDRNSCPNKESSSQNMVAAESSWSALRTQATRTCPWFWHPFLMGEFMPSELSLFLSGDRAGKMFLTFHNCQCLRLKDAISLTDLSCQVLQLDVLSRRLRLCRSNRAGFFTISSVFGLQLTRPVTPTSGWGKELSHGKCDVELH